MRMRKTSKALVTTVLIALRLKERSPGAEVHMKVARLYDRIA